MGHYWVNIDFEKVKIVLKSLVMGLSCVIFLNHRALISVFDHFSLWISFFLLVFASRSQKLTTIELPFECQILLCRNSTRTISLGHTLTYWIVVAHQIIVVLRTFSEINNCSPSNKRSLEKIWKKIINVATLNNS